MSLLAGDSISPSDFTTLKNKIKNIMLTKRIYYGSLEAYGSAEYDYDIDPTTNGTILVEHQNKIVIPMRAITTNNVDAVATQNDKIISLYNINTIINAFDAKTATSSVNDCQNYCSGLCVTQCSTGCTGCSNNCAKNCANNCTGGCSGDCDGGCDGGCEGCGGCGNTCKNTCKNRCSSTCVGCSGGCISTCGTHCSTTCTAMCKSWSHQITN